MSKKDQSEKIINEESEETIVSEENMEDTSNEQPEEEDNQQEEEDGEDEENSLEQELGEAKDKYLRLYSEFENFRRRTSKEKRDIINTANKDLIADILPVLDDFDRALQATDDPNAFLEGIKLIQSKLNKSLENKGLKKMETQKGDEFNDDSHEAVTQISADDDLVGKVVDVVEPGYILGEKVIKFAKVVVGAKQ